MTSIIDFQLDLSVKDKEILCSLNPTHGLAKWKQKRTASKLAKLYKQGYRKRKGQQLEEVNPDKKKALEYRIQSGKPDNRKKAAGWFSSLLLYFKSKANLSTTLEVAGWFTSLRLFLMRINRILDFFHHAFMPALAKLGGVSYAVDLLSDLGTVFYDTFRPRETPTDCDHPEFNMNLPARLWRRFKLSITEDKRPYRLMMNTVWLAVNLTCLFVSGGIYWILNLCGFSADTVLDIGYGIKVILEHFRLLRKLNSQIEKLKQPNPSDTPLSEENYIVLERYHKLKRYDNIIKDLKCHEDLLEKEKKYITKYNEETFRDGFYIDDPDDSDPSALNEDIHKKLSASLPNERYHALIDLRSQLRQKLAWLFIKHGYQVLLTALVLVGMILVFTNPPLAIPIAGILLGAGIAFLAGSVFGGLGKKITTPIFNKVWSLGKSAWHYFTKPKPKQPLIKNQEKIVSTYRYLMKNNKPTDPISKQPSVPVTDESKQQSDMVEVKHDHYSPDSPLTPFPMGMRNCR